MGTKTISIMDEVYNKLRQHKHKNESFSEEIRRLLEKCGRISECAGLWDWMSQKDVEGINAEAIINLEKLLSRIEVLPLERKGATLAGEINGKLLKQGKQIDDADSLTAGIAKANHIRTIITRNVKHFEKIEGIAVEAY